MIKQQCCCWKIQLNIRAIALAHAKLTSNSWEKRTQHQPIDSSVSPSVVMFKLSNQALAYHVILAIENVFVEWIYIFMEGRYFLIKWIYIFIEGRYFLIKRKYFFIKWEYFNEWKLIFMCEIIFLIKQKYLSFTRNSFIRWNYVFLWIQYKSNKTHFC